MKQHFNSITAFMLAFIIAFTICFPIFTIAKTKTVKADTLAWEKVGIPIFTFFVLAGKSARDQLANDLTQFGKDTARGAKIWWDKLSGAQRDKIQSAYDNNSYIDVSEYRGFGFEDIPSYTNKYEYSPSLPQVLRSMSSSDVELANQIFKKIADFYGVPFSVKYVSESISDNSFTYLLSAPGYFSKKFTIYSDTFKIDNIYGTYKYNQSSSDFVFGSIFFMSRLMGVVPVSDALKVLAGHYYFEYSPTAELPTSLDFSQLKNIGSDISSIKGLYDSTSKTVVDMSSILSKVDSSTGALVDSSQGNLEEVKKSNGFLGTIKDYLTITLPDTLTGIGSDVKAIPSAVATSISNLFVVEDTYFKSKFLEYDNLLKKKYPTLDLSFMKISPEPPRDYYIDIMGSKGKILNFSNTTNDSSILSFIRLVFNAIFVFLLIVFNYNQIVSLIRRSSPLVTSSSVYVDGGGKK